MYVDDKIQLRPDLPEGLQDDFRQLQKFYEADDWFQFDVFFESVEATVKAYYLSGKIDITDLKQIFQKYGIA